MDATLLPRFVSEYPKVKNIVVDYMKSFELPSYHLDYIDGMISYNLVGGKMYRGLTTLKTIYKLSGGKLSDEQFSEACSLGWCVEWLQSSVIVVDDVIDQAKTRRDKSCWHLREEVGLESTNDGFILQDQMYHILEVKFRKHPNYVELVELFRKAAMETALGKLVDSAKLPDDDYTMDTYLKIAHMKTAIYTFYLPIAAGYIYMKHSNEDILKAIRDISLQFGEYFQIQDDYIDCFTDSKIAGKVGTDIKNKKCSWVLIKALEIGNELQKKTIYEHIGKDNIADEKAVKKVYQDLKINEQYEKYEEEKKKAIEAMIAKSPINREVLTDLLAHLYHRSK